MSERGEGVGERRGCREGCRGREGDNKGKEGMCDKWGVTTDHFLSSRLASCPLPHCLLLLLSSYSFSPVLPLLHLFSPSFLTLKKEGGRK